MTGESTDELDPPPGKARTEAPVREPEQSPPESLLTMDLPDAFKDKVVSVSTPLRTGKDIERYERLEDIRNKSRKLRTILNAWETQQREERGLRRFYAKGLLAALFAQILLVNAAFFAIGLNYLVIDKWVATTFIMAVFAEIIALVSVVNKYLFPKVGSEVLDLIEKM